MGTRRLSRLARERTDNLLIKFECLLENITDRRRRKMVFAAVTDLVAARTRKRAVSRFSNASIAF
jgi:hypothetical protein